eukprot:scaffold48889_cov28-Prasinocladus_malaysianus.AAC.1
MHAFLTLKRIVIDKLAWMAAARQPEAKACRSLNACMGLIHSACCRCNHLGADACFYGWMLALLSQDNGPYKGRTREPTSGFWLGILPWTVLLIEHESSLGALTFSALLKSLFGMCVASGT